MSRQIDLDTLQDWFSAQRPVTVLDVRTDAARAQWSILTTRMLDDGQHQPERRQPHHGHETSPLCMEHAQLPCQWQRSRRESGHDEPGPDAARVKGARPDG
jgi:hypothetical protein